VHILNHGRAALLDFLRNLTPQVLLTTLAVLAFSAAYKNKEGLLCVVFLFLGAVFTAALLLSALANSIQFIVSYHITHPDKSGLLAPVGIVSIAQLEKAATEKGVSISKWSLYFTLFFVEIIFLGAIAFAGYNLGVLRFA